MPYGINARPDIGWRTKAEGRRKVNADPFNLFPLVLRRLAEREGA